MFSKRQFFGSSRLLNALTEFGRDFVTDALRLLETFDLDSGNEEEREETLLKLGTMGANAGSIEPLLDRTRHLIEDGALHADFEERIAYIFNDVINDGLGYIELQILDNVPLYETLNSRGYIGDGDPTIVRLVRALRDAHAMLPSKHDLHGGIEAQHQLPDSMLDGRTLPQPYQFSPFPTGTSIRLVTVDPHTGKDDNSMIQLTSHVVDLEDDPEYSALSYTWSKPCAVFPSVTERDKPYRTDVPVLCDGRLLYVGENLYLYLREWRRDLNKVRERHSEAMGDPEGINQEQDQAGYRCKACPKDLWVDAMCINQGDADERSAQVALMGAIYRRSLAVIVWLGAEDCYTRGADRILYQSRGWKIPKGFESLDSLSIDELREMMDLPAGDAWGWVCLWAFLNRTWFRRNWVIQELALSPDNEKTIIKCGYLTTRWEMLVDIVRFLRGIGISRIIEDRVDDELEGREWRLESVHPDGTVVARIGDQSDELPTLYFSEKYGMAPLDHFVSILDGVREPLVKTKDTTIDALALLFTDVRNFECSEPRDKVYGVLELIKRPCYHTGKEDSRRRDIQVNYQLPTTQVYLEAAWYVLLSSHDLQILGEVGGIWSREVTIDGLPSWVFPLTARPRRASLQLTSIREEFHWKASGQHVWQAPEMPHLYQPYLTLEGGFVDGICDIGSHTDKLLGSFDIARHLPPTYEWTQTGQSTVEALWQTMTCASSETWKRDGDPRVEEAYMSILLFLFEGRHCEDCTSDPESCVDAFDSLVARAQGYSDQRPSNPNTKMLNLHREDGSTRHRHITVGQTAGTRFIPPPSLIDFDWRPYIPHGTTRLSCSQILDPLDPLEAVFQYLQGRKWESSSYVAFRTEGGLLGYTMAGVELGDVIYIAAGSTVPFILRPLDNGRFSFISEAYAHGIMYGETLERDGFTFQSIEIE